MPSLVPSAAKTTGRIVIVLMITITAGFFAWANGMYGVLGVYAAFIQHEARGATVYLLLLCIAALCTGVVAIAWLWLLRGQKRRKNGT